MTGEIMLSAPMLLVYEVGSALAKCPPLGEDDSEKIFQSLLDLTIKLRSFAEPKLLRKCFQVSKKLRITFYDALYVALAKESQAALITADRELHGKVRRYCDSQLLSDVALEKLVGRVPIE